LQCAAADDSSFPRRLMYKLAPSCYSDDFSLLGDLCLLSACNSKSALLLASQVEEADRSIDSESLAMLKRLRKDAQQPDAVDRMAQLFHVGPEAAAIVLDLLLVRPIIKDRGHHNIRSRASLWGFPSMRPMRCDYQPDSITRDGLDMPEWRFNSSLRNDPKEQPQIAWHWDLVKAVGHDQDGRSYVQDVDTKAILMPNILDIDLLWALACVRPEHSHIFSRVPVQGIVYCMWDHLAVRVFYLRLGWTVMEAAVQTSWGMAQSDRIGSRSPLGMPLSKAVIAAGVLRDAVAVLFGFYNHCRKFREHRAALDAWKRRATAAASPGAVPSHQHTKPPSLHSLWRPSTFFGVGLLGELLLLASKVTFLLCVIGAVGTEMDTSPQTLLTTMAMLQSLKAIHAVRLTTWGKKITTIMKTFFSTSIFEMLVVEVLFFACALSAFATLERLRPASSVMRNVFQGMILADGGALEQLGLNDDGSGSRSGMIIVCTIVLNICMLNLTIAIYSSEYDRLVDSSEQDFLRERAKMSCSMLLEVPKLPMGSESMSWRRYGIVGCAVMAVASALALAQELSSAVQGAVLIATAEVLAEALLMASSWFPWRSEEGPETPHFLWLCYPSDDATGGGDALDSRIAALETSQRRLCSSLREVEGRLESRIGEATELLRVVAQAVAKDART